MSVKLLFFAGSSRKDSLNKKLARAAYELAVGQGATATFIDLQDYQMPIYNGDWEDENGLPEAAMELKKIFADHDGLFIASPENNSAYSSLLKNTIDWISRSHFENEPALSAYQNKVAAIVAASPGALGGLRGLVSLRMLLGNISVMVIPDQMTLRSAHQAFDAEGHLKEEAKMKTLSKIVRKLIDAARIGIAVRKT